MNNKIEIKKVQNAKEFLVARELIFEYVKWLGIDLSFQNHPSPCLYSRPEA